VVPGAGIRLSRLMLRSLRTVDVSVGALTDPIRLALSIPQALAVLAAWRPAAIFTTGGYVAMPVAGAAALLRIPVVLWEGNVVPGRSSRVVARLSRVVAVSFAPTAPALQRPAYVTGTPIRNLQGLDHLAAREHFEIAAGERCTLVFGGSQAVRRFDEAVGAALPELLARTAVIHVTGEAAYGPALARREALPAELRERYRPYPFLREEMASALAAADIVVGRAGASTLAEVTAMGTPLVVVPYPHAAGHQTANARILADAGAALLIADEAFDGAALLEAVATLSDPRRHAEMGAASRALGRPRAADAVAELVVALAERTKLPPTSAIEALSRGGVA
jgi:UDP-N-acetylglucosamine--N-acetylmuramyl-(pentapeptide) pyrophosphoryl-undecaprenol N-acetylglucosamine transferase